MFLDLAKLALFFAYCFLGDKANRYLKYHLLNVRAEFYSDTGKYILSRLIKGGLLGWITIPIAILHYCLFTPKR